MFNDNLNQEPEDIFSQHDPVKEKNRPQPVKLQSANQNSNQFSSQPQVQQRADDLIEIRDENKSGVIKKIILIVGVILIVAGLSFGVWYFLKHKSPVTQKDLDNINIQAEENLIPDNPIAIPLQAETQISDQDHDGLSDEEEMALGTDLNNVDSDGDGLFDRDEVKIYETNPLNLDTDGDGYSDGEEVKNNYNPRGEGKLRDFEKELQKLKDTQGF
ncbi:MAG: hypothetical protein PHS07_01335 [Patescibacteria group bacterium]|nr:hypothetical protein [Patescibacteria group bacterium]